MLAPAARHGLQLRYIDGGGTWQPTQLEQDPINRCGLQLALCRRTVLPHRCIATHGHSMRCSRQKSPQLLSPNPVSRLPKSRDLLLFVGDSKPSNATIITAKCHIISGASNRHSPLHTLRRAAPALSSVIPSALPWKQDIHFSFLPHPAQVFRGDDLREFEQQCK